MGFCTEKQHRRFPELGPLFEKYIVEGGATLFNFWPEVGNEEQERRFKARIEDPPRQWKLSPVDLPSREQVCNRANHLSVGRIKDYENEKRDQEGSPLRHALSH